MIEAFFWGAVGASALLVGALVAYGARPSPKVIAVVMALGAGLLIGSVAFELVDEALETTEVARVGLFTLVGAATFTLGNWWLDRRGAGDRKDSEGAQASGAPLAIVFGSVLDGVPESFVLGLTVLQGGVSVALLVGVVLSNLPEGLSSSSGLRIAGWPRARVVRMWLVVIAVAAVSAALGYALLDPASGRTGAFAQGFAAGALLAMVTDTMLPEAYEVERISTRCAGRDRVRDLADALGDMSTSDQEDERNKDPLHLTPARSPRTVPSDSPHRGDAVRGPRESHWARGGSDRDPPWRQGHGRRDAGRPASPHGQKA